MLSFAKTPLLNSLLVTCYTASLYVIDFKSAHSSGEAQDAKFDLAFLEALVEKVGHDEQSILRALQQDVPVEIDDGISREYLSDGCSVSVCDAYCV